MKPPDREKLVNDLHKAVRAYVEGNGGKVWSVGPINVDVHKATSFDVVVAVVGEPPKARPDPTRNPQ
jgi:hypothetical protein